MSDVVKLSFILLLCEKLVEEEIKVEILKPTSEFGKLVHCLANGPY